MNTIIIKDSNDTLGVLALELTVSINLCIIKHNASIEANHVYTICKNDDAENMISDMLEGYVKHDDVVAVILAYIDSNILDHEQYEVCMNNGEVSDVILDLPLAIKVLASLPRQVQYIAAPAIVGAFIELDEPIM